VSYTHRNRNIFLDTVFRRNSKHIKIRVEERKYIVTRMKKKTECVVKTHDRSETFVLQGNIVIIPSITFK
jgi:hypothetical protein